MVRYPTRQDFANASDWEGGLLDFVFGYGVAPEDVPESDTELREAIEAVIACGPAIEHLRSLLPDPE